MKALLRPSAKSAGTEGDFPAVVHYQKETIKAEKAGDKGRSEERRVGKEC